jgi:hypothetical protein
MTGNYPPSGGDERGAEKPLNKPLEPAVKEKKTPKSVSAEEKTPKDKVKKQIPLRLTRTLYNDVLAWAEDDFRSLNGQIEYLLTECVKARKKGKSD